MMIKIPNTFNFYNNIINAPQLEVELLKLHYT